MPKLKLFGEMVDITKDDIKALEILRDNNFVVSYKSFTLKSKGKEKRILPQHEKNFFLGISAAIRIDDPDYVHLMTNEVRQFFAENPTETSCVVGDGIKIMDILDRVNKPKKT